MRTDQPWLEVVRNVRQALSAKPQPLVEEEVAPGTILFGPGRRQWLALLGTVFGMGGAGAMLATTASRQADIASIIATAADPDYASYFEIGVPREINLLPFGQDIEHEPDLVPQPLLAILQPGRRLDPAR